MTYNELKNSKRYLNINIDGNAKLKNNNNVRFIIWNLPAIKTCPFSTDMCRKSCYAKRAERYPSCKDSRETNYIKSLQDDFIENMIFTIETELNTKKFNNKKVVFRIHESGDFYSRHYYNKWVAIAKHFENNKNIVFLAYTKSIHFIEYGNKPNNLFIRFSKWADTNLNDELTAFLDNVPIYTAMNPDEIEKERVNGNKFVICRCVDCATCGLCWNPNIKDIVVKIH